MSDFKDRNTIVNNSWKHEDLQAWIDELRAAGAKSVYIDRYELRIEWFEHASSTKREVLNEEK